MGETLLPSGHYPLSFKHKFVTRHQFIYYSGKPEVFFKKKQGKKLKVHC